MAGGNLIAFIGLYCDMDALQYWADLQVCIWGVE